jgi:hypothetical protein
MKSLIFACLFISTNIFAQNILVIGDSHTAGPFGARLHELLSKQFANVVTLGHASSSAYHWIETSDFKLSGGVFHAMQFAGLQYKHPAPTDWREKVSVPKISNVLAQNAVHASWQKVVQGKLQADIVVVALGANDARLIADDHGRINRAGYLQRKLAIEKLIQQIEKTHARCLWIAPPHGSKKTDANQKALYQFLKETIKDRCPLFDSNHFVATGCDGVHFSCSSQLPKAHRWASEVTDFIINNY